MDFDEISQHYLPKFSNLGFTHYSSEIAVFIIIDALPIPQTKALSLLLHFITSEAAPLLSVRAHD